MLRTLVVALGLFVWGTGAALALSFDRCEKTEITLITTAIDGAGELALRASVAIDDTPGYATWFGRWDPVAAEVIRANLKAIHDTVTTGEIRARCGNAHDGGCEDETYAFVYPEDALILNLCPKFFEQPGMSDFEPGSELLEYGTREGTIIHEISHFKSVADTDDICYGRTVCSDMARRDPYGAATNADTYQYFSEDRGWDFILLRLHPVRRGGNRG